MVHIDRTADAGIKNGAFGGGESSGWTLERVEDLDKQKKGTT